MNPDSLENTADLKPGKWTTASASFDFLRAAAERGIYFVVPPGKGFIYLKNLSVTP